MNGQGYETIEEFLAACAQSGVVPALVMITNYPLHGHLLPDLVKLDYYINGPVGASGMNMLHYACHYMYPDAIRMLVNLGADPSITHHDNSIFDLVVRSESGYTWKNDSSRWRKALDAVVSVYPQGLHRESNGGRCPIDGAVSCSRKDMVQGLVEAGCSFDSKTMKLAVSLVDTPRIWESTISKDICRYLVENGGRIGDEPDPDFIRDGKGYKFYLSVVTAVERCIGAAVIIIGLPRVGGRVHGNGRDALRLVAREVLKSKSFNDWHGKMDWLEKRMKMK